MPMRGRTNTTSTEPVPVVDEEDKTAGKSRAGQTPDLEGFLKKRGDQGRIKMWKKRHFRLFKKEGVIAYFRSEKDTEQLGEISVTGAFLIDRREDLGKLVFTLTMKTSARVWILQASDEDTLNRWMDACTPMLSEKVPAVRLGDGKKAPKPRPGLPLPFPPTYVQGWSKLDNHVIASGADDWTGLAAKTPVFPTKPTPGAVGLSVSADGSAVVDEVRQLALDAHKETYVTDLPAEIVAESVTWAADDSFMVQTRFEHDAKTQHDVLRKLVGRKVTATYTNVQGAGNSLSYTGKVFYDHADDRFALVDEGTSTIHFFDLTALLAPAQDSTSAGPAVRNDRSVPGAHTLQLLDVDCQKLNPHTTDAFVAPRLWARLTAGGAATTGSLTYHLKPDTLPCQVNYAVVLSADESSAHVNGWYSVQNKSSKTWTNASVTYKAGDREEEKDAQAPELEDKAGALADAAGAGGLLGGIRAKAALLAGGGGAEDKSGGRFLLYPLVPSVTLKSHETTNAGFLAAKVPMQTGYLITFDTPGYSIKPLTNKDEGQVSQGFGNANKEASAIVATVARFKNPLPLALPTGEARVTRRDRSGVGAHHLTTTRLLRIEGGEEMVVNLGPAAGISASRRQTGYNFDAEKHFMIETFEIVVANARQETVAIKVEDSLFRWGSWEITHSKPAHARSAHPRKIHWDVRLNHGEDITIKYSVFYTSFDLPSDYEEPAK